MKKKYLSLAACLIYFCCSCLFGSVPVSSAEQLNDEKVITMIAIGSDYKVAVRSDGTVYSWGQNLYGQLGYERIFSDIPRQVEGLTDIVAVACGNYHTVALDKNGLLWSWGLNKAGQLGVKSIERSFKPVPVKGINDVIAISCCRDMTVALKKDGTVWRWGAKFKKGEGIKNPLYGDLKYGDYYNYQPVQVKEISDATAIWTTPDSIYFKKKDGTVFEYVLSIYEIRAAPKELNNPISIDIASYSDDSYRKRITVKKQDGTIWTLGYYNDYIDSRVLLGGKYYDVKEDKDGKKYVEKVLDNGKTVTEYMFKHGFYQRFDLSTMISVSECQDGSIGLKNDGTVWINKLFKYRKLSSGKATKVEGLSDIVYINSNFNSYVAVERDGTIWQWGEVVTKNNTIQYIDNPQKISVLRRYDPDKEIKK